ncbi:cupin domain-containing protein [Patescibacteria group bacterium]
MKMKNTRGYVSNLSREVRENCNFRKVLYTSENMQLVIMDIDLNEDIGEEIHESLDQCIRVESGEGKAVLDGEECYIEKGFMVVVPAGTKHNIINTSNTFSLKLYTIYSPPEHQDGTIHPTKKDAESNNKHFNGIITGSLK